MTAINGHYYNILMRLCLLALAIVLLIELVLVVHIFRYIWRHRYDNTSFFTDGSSFKEGLRYNLEIDRERFIEAFNGLKGRINEKLGKH